MEALEGAVTLDALVGALLDYDGRYQSLDFVVRNVRELVDANNDGQLGGGMKAVSRHRIHFESHRGTFEIRIHPSGIGRLRRAEASAPSVDPLDVLVALGEAMEAIEEREMPQQVLGFMLGDPIAEAPGASRWALSVRFERDHWRAYTGAMTRWLRERSSAADQDLRVAKVAAG